MYGPLSLQWLKNNYKSFDMTIDNPTPHLPTYLPIYLLTHPSINLPTYLLTYPLTHDSPTNLLMRPPIYQPIYLPTYPPTHTWLTYPFFISYLLQRLPTFYLLFYNLPSTYLINFSYYYQINMWNKKTWQKLDPLWCCSSLVRTWLITVKV